MIILYLFLYLLVGTCFGATMSAILDIKDDEAEIFMLIIFWPIMIGVMILGIIFIIPYYLTYYLIKGNLREKINEFKEEFKDITKIEKEE